MRTQHPLEVHRFDDMVEEGLEVHEKTIRDLLEEILDELKLFNQHMQIITGEEVVKDDYT